MNKYLYYLCLFFVIFSGCKNKDSCINAYNLVTIISPTGYSIRSVILYEVPSGAVRAIGGPDSQKQAFELLINANKKEMFCNIPVPQTFVDKIENISGEWDWFLKEKSANKLCYILKKKDQESTFQIELPNRNKTYTFFMLRNNINCELIVFCDLSETIESKSVFGYVFIDKCY